MKLLIFLLTPFFKEIFTFPNQDSGHIEEGLKSHESFGIRNLFFVAIVTKVKPNNPPIIDGNSGPKKIPVKA